MRASPVECEGRCTLWLTETENLNQTTIEQLGEQTVPVSLTFLLVADENLQGNGSLHLHRHLIVVDQAVSGQLESVLQVLVTFELHLTEVMQHPASLGEKHSYSVVRRVKAELCSSKTGHFIKRWTLVVTNTHPGSHVAQLTAEQREDVILQHELHLVFVNLFLCDNKYNWSTLTQQLNSSQNTD